MALVMPKETLVPWQACKETTRPTKDEWFCLTRYSTDCKAEKTDDKDQSNVSDNSCIGDSAGI